MSFPLFRWCNAIHPVSPSVIRGFDAYSGLRPIPGTHHRQRVIILTNAHACKLAVLGPIRRAIGHAKLCACPSERCKPTPVYNTNNRKLTRKQPFHCQYPSPTWPAAHHFNYDEPALPSGTQFPPPVSWKSFTI